LFSKLWINKEQLNADTNITAYLYSAVRNACLNQIKHQKVKDAYASIAITSFEVNSHIESKIDASELHKLIESSIFELPPERQKIFLLSREQGLKYQEIADRLGISIKTVEAQMGKALKFLREQLKEYLIVMLLCLINFFKD
jgi:RNA polymerase sigma-70 factor, ECF subfamily